VGIANRLTPLQRASDRYDDPADHTNDALTRPSRRTLARCHRSVAPTHHTESSQRLSRSRACAGAHPSTPFARPPSRRPRVTWSGDLVLDLLIPLCGEIRTGRDREPCESCGYSREGVCRTRDCRTGCAPMEYVLHRLMRVSFGVALQAHGVSIVDLVRPRSCRCLSVVPSAALVLSKNFLTFQHGRR
jgi:hypothetical protein